MVRYRAKIAAAAKVARSPTTERVTAAIEPASLQLINWASIFSHSVLEIKK